MILAVLVDLVLALPHGLVLAEVPRQPVLLLHLLEVFPYAQGPEGAGDEEEHKVTAIRETASFGRTALSNDS